LDVLDEAAVSAAAGHVAAIGEPNLIVVATGQLSAAGAGPEKSMRALDAKALMEMFAVNAVGPALVAKHLLPLTPRARPALFAALSARVGSIGDDRLGGWYGYRASKAALNMMVRNLAIEYSRTHPKGVCVALHPGTVDTPLSAPFRSTVLPERLLSPRQSAGALLDVMNGLGPADTGGFFDWKGVQIPW
jgi:NAD(P)-dependent dehydrogenase (short-subunit alcohol dehydrogenase family)